MPPPSMTRKSLVRNPLDRYQEAVVGNIIQLVNECNSVAELNTAVATGWLSNSAIHIEPCVLLRGQATFTVDRQVRAGSITYRVLMTLPFQGQPELLFFYPTVPPVLPSQLEWNLGQVAGPLDRSRGITSLHLQRTGAKFLEISLMPTTPTEAHVENLASSLVDALQSVLDTQVPDIDTMNSGLAYFRSTMVTQRTNMLNGPNPLASLGPGV